MILNRSSLDLSLLNSRWSSHSAWFCPLCRSIKLKWKKDYFAQLLNWTIFSKQLSWFLQYSRKSPGFSVHSGALIAKTDLNFWAFCTWFLDFLAQFYLNSLWVFYSIASGVWFKFDSGVISLNQILCYAYQPMTLLHFGWAIDYVKLLFSVFVSKWFE